MRTVLKVDTDKRRVYGIALAADEPDSQGDLVTDNALEEAAVRAVKKGTVGVKVNHAGQSVGRLVASFPLTADIAKAMGIARPSGVSVWLVGLEIEDEQTWQLVKAGTLTVGLSVGGRGSRRALR